MYKKLNFLLLPVLILCLVNTALTQDVLIRNPDMAMPVIDGIVDEVWLFSSEQTIGTITAGTAPSSPADCSGTWWSLWNSETLLY